VKRGRSGEIERFRELVKGMSCRSLVYKMLKEELGRQGRWKNLPRGKKGRGFYDGGV